MHFVIGALKWMVTAGETAGRRSAQTKIYGKGKLGITVIKITLNDLKFCL